MLGRRTLLAAICGLFASGAAELAAAELHDEIDRLIAARAGDVSLAPACDDATFARRVHLDFAGRVPRPDETRRFLAETATDKRARLIDERLASPEYARRMAELFHVVLMERRGDDPEWTKFLQTSFAANRPWDAIARDVLRPDETDENRRGAAYFHVRRLQKEGEQPTDHPGLTRDVGRLFLGVDLQCAQCHDHLFIDDYKQVDFQGLFVVFSQTAIKSGVKFPAIAEKPLAAKLEFASVFEGVKHTVGPRVPFGPEFEPPAPPSAKDAPSPSALALLADSIASRENRSFARNAANRFWFLLMGRGLVHPLDLHHRGNPPSHPELLELLTDELVAHDFDVKWFLRELALSRTYARSSELTAGEPPAPELFALALERRLSAEQLLRSLLVATAPLDEAADDAKLAARFDALRPKALKAFANPAKEPEESYNATVAGALTLLNDEAFLRLFEPTDAGLVERVAKLEDAGAAVDELYVALLARFPSDEERGEAIEFVNRYSGERRATGLQRLAWALAASMEFSVIH